MKIKAEYIDAGFFGVVYDTDPEYKFYAAAYGGGLVSCESNAACFDTSEEAEWAARTRLAETDPDDLDEMIFG